MLKKERQDFILKIVTDRRYCTVAHLSQQLHVAPVTVRRDLEEMETALRTIYGNVSLVRCKDKCGNEHLSLLWEDRV